MDRRKALRAVISGSVLLASPVSRALGAAPVAAPFGLREDWLRLLLRIAEPVLAAGARGSLFTAMPVEQAAGQKRHGVSALEAFARTLAGIAPWLESGASTGEEGKARERMTSLATQALVVAVDKASPGFLRFGQERQTIVDAGFLALAISRAPRALLQSTPAGVRTQLADALRSTRKQTPPFNNWLLFAAMVEVCLFQLGDADWDRTRIDYALREHAAWFLGDGTYGDGPHYHADYYNSYVIHPFLLAILDVVGSQDAGWSAMKAPVLERAKRYALVQERCIAPDGSFPAIGRSITYRCGAFHLLADVALRGELPPALPPAQVRCALSAVMARTLLAGGTFDAQGWLTIGLAGHQPQLGEPYISTGSLYLCTAAFLPLGLAQSHAFWAGPATEWTSQKVWSGQDVAADHAVE